MLTVRRIYLYAVSAISFVAVAWAVIGLFRLILGEGFGQGEILGLAWVLAVIIVGLPIFLFHWLMAQRLTSNSPDEQESPVRCAFFYIVMAAAAAPVLSNIYRLLDDALIVLVGGARPDYYPYDLTVPDHLAAILVWGVVWVYLWRFVRHLPDTTANRTIRRLYLLLFSLGGLIMTAWGAFGLLQQLMEMAVGQVWRTAVANYSAQALMGAAIWLAHWRLLQQSFASGHPAEERSVLRKVYLYLNVFAFSVMALVSGTLLLKRLLELALGAPPAKEPLLLQLSTPVPLLIVGGLFWAYHWFVIKNDAVQAPDGPRQATVRRIYAYLVAFVGLTATLTGVGGLLVLLVDMLTTAEGLAFYREEVALFAALTLFGVPVWVLPWQRSQARALQPAAADSQRHEGAEERRSTVRKIYMYFFVFVAALVVFGSVGWFVYHILTALLGADLPDDFTTLVLDALVLGLLAIGVWVYHWLAIRQDGRLAEQEESAQLADVVVVVIDGGEGQLGQAVVGKLKKDLPGIQLRPLGVTAQAAAAMGGEPFSAALLDMANIIVGPWQALTASEVEPAVEASPATKFVVPLADKEWVWTGVKTQSAAAHASQIARGVKQVIDGEAVSFEREMDVATIAGIVVGGLLFLCVAGSLLSFVGSLL